MIPIILSMATLFLTDMACAVQYGVVLDAGSSSTKLRVYSWAERSSTSSTLNIREIYQRRKTPSLSSFEDDLDLLPDYLLTLTSMAESQVPNHSQENTHIYLFATAGLRFLKENKAKGLMDTVRVVLSNKRNHNFKYTARSVRILSGEEEGVFAWISANYHNGSFSSNQPLSKVAGVLEMGGGSTQITFIPDGPLLAHMFTLRIAGRTYDLYSHSYLNFGTDYMVRRIKEYLIKNTAIAFKSAPYYNPCSLKDDSYSYNYEGRNVAFIGSGLPSECLKIITTFLKPSLDTCYPKPCAIGSIYQPSIGSDIFYATSSFAVTITYLNATDASGWLDIDKLNKTAHIYCKETIEGAATVYSVPSTYGSSTCMMALYITELLTSYGFPVNTNRIFPLQQFNGESIEWPLGAMVYEAELLETDYPCNPISSGASVLVEQHPVHLLELVVFLYLFSLRV